MGNRFTAVFGKNGGILIVLGIKENMFAFIINQEKSNWDKKVQSIKANSP